MSNSEVYTESQTKPFIWTAGVDCSNSVNCHDRRQLLSYSKYSLLFLSIVGIEPAISRWFPSEALSNQAPYPLHHCPCWTILWKKAKDHFFRNVVNITTKMRSIVWLIRANLFFPSVYLALVYQEYTNINIGHRWVGTQQNILQTFSQHNNGMISVSRKCFLQVNHYTWSATEIFVFFYSYILE